MRTLLVLILLTGCNPADFARSSVPTFEYEGTPLSEAERAGVYVRFANVVRCLNDRRSPRRDYAPRVVVGKGCWLDAPGTDRYVRGHTDQRNYVRVGRDLAALEHELAHFLSGSLAHGEESMSYVCGDLLSRDWRKLNPAEFKCEPKPEE